MKMNMKMIAVLATWLGLSTALRFDNKSPRPAKPLNEALRTGLAAIVLLSAAPSKSEMLESMALRNIGYNSAAQTIAPTIDEQQQAIDASNKAKIEKDLLSLTFDSFETLKGDYYAFLDFKINLILTATMLNVLLFGTILKFFYWDIEVYTNMILENRKPFDFENES